MSFLKFLGNKGVAPKNEDLDLPPLPPPLKGPEGKLDPIEQMPPFDEELPELEKTAGKGPSLPELHDMPLAEFPTAPPIPEALNTEEISPEEEKHDTGIAESFEMPEEKPEIKAGPIFIKIDKYRDVLKEVNKIKADFDKSKSILSSMVEIKASEDKELESWKYGLEDIRKKLSFIDNSIFGG